MATVAAVDMKVVAIEASEPNGSDGFCGWGGLDEGEGVAALDVEDGAEGLGLVGTGAMGVRGVIGAIDDGGRLMPKISFGEDVGGGIGVSSEKTMRGALCGTNAGEVSKSSPKRSKALEAS